MSTAVGQPGNYSKLPFPLPQETGSGDDIIDIMKKVGIKYCGGCNPSYERVEMVQQVQSLLKDRFIFSVNDQRDSDIMVFVCGCPRACVNKNSYESKVPFRSIVGESDFKSLVDWLEGFGAKGDL